MARREAWGYSPNMAFSIEDTCSKLRGSSLSSRIVADKRNSKKVYYCYENPARKFNILISHKRTRFPATETTWREDEVTYIQSYNVENRMSELQTRSVSR